MCYTLPINDENYVLVYKDIGYYANEGNYRIYRAFFDLVPVTNFSTSTSNIFTDVAFMNFDNSKDSYSFFVHFDLVKFSTPALSGSDSMGMFSARYIKAPPTQRITAKVAYIIYICKSLPFEALFLYCIMHSTLG